MTTLISEAQFRAMMPLAGARLDPHWPYINPALEKAAIDTPARITAFLAQLAHESAEYRHMEEIADGSAYEGRRDLGNVNPGDGRRFKGHGPIQITGRTNHWACGLALGIDLVANPLLLTTPQYGTASACWFWNSRQLSLLADRGWFVAITRAINGGTNGLHDRVRYWHNNCRILGLMPDRLDDEVEEIKAFQRSHGLTADGAVGRKTLRKLELAA